MKFIALAIVLTFLCGCVPHPIHKTLQPEAFVTISDSNANRLSGATVVLISSAYPYGFEKFRVSVRSRNGFASFFKIKDFRIESTMIHGAESYFWNWCVSLEGYKTIETAHRSGADFDRRPVFVMEPGTSTPCSEEPHR